MGEELKIAALPLDIVWADVERNIDTVDEKLTALPEGTDIVVLPGNVLHGVHTGRAVACIDGRRRFQAVA